MSSARTGTRTRALVSAALLASLMAATSWLSAQLPTTVVPLTPQVFFVVLAALLLPAGWAGAGVATYVVLGAVGLPVFSAGRGGLGVLAGPTGGYLFGFIAGAMAGALVRRAVEPRASQGLADAAGAVTAVVAAYALGTVQLALVANLSPAAAIAAGVVPFIALDAVKAAVAIGVASAVRRARR